MYDFDNDQLGVFEFEQTYAEDLETMANFEAQDEIVASLESLYDDELTKLAELVEAEDAGKLREYFNDFYGVFEVACDDEFNAEAEIIMETILTDRGLPTIEEIEDGSI